MGNICIWCTFSQYHYFKATRQTETLNETQHNIQHQPGRQFHRVKIQMDPVCLQKQLGHGYSANIWLGTQGDKDVVVKSYKKTKDKKFAQHYMMESKVYDRCKHPHIVFCFGTKDTGIVVEDKENRKNYMDPNEDILLLEHCALGDMYQLLQEQPQQMIPSERMLRALIKPVVAALQYAFEQGVSHRDIKLENIFIDENGIIKVGDWGLSTVNRHSKRSAGTLAYMAPEMVCRQQYCANKVDTWAVGVLLFSLCNGTRPYGEPKARKKHSADDSWKDEWLSAMLNQKWQLWWLSHARVTPQVGKMSESLCDLIQHMLDPDPNLRLSTAQILDHRWMNDPDIATAKEIVELKSKKN